MEDFSTSISQWFTNYNYLFIENLETSWLLQKGQRRSIFCLFQSVSITVQSYDQEDYSLKFCQCDDFTVAQPLTPPWNAWDEWKAKSLVTRPSWLPGLFLKSKQAVTANCMSSLKIDEFFFTSVTKLFPEWKLLLISSNRALQVRIFQFLLISYWFLAPR